MSPALEELPDLEAVATGREKVADEREAHAIDRLEPAVRRLILRDVDGRLYRDVIRLELRPR